LHRWAVSDGSQSSGARVRPGTTIQQRTDAKPVLRQPVDNGRPIPVTVVT
jgi:hypothetical protein